MSYVLTIEADYMPADVHGPFETIEQAQVYARNYRRVNNVPGHTNVEPTPEENEAWTDAGWDFAIVELGVELRYAHPEV